MNEKPLVSVVMPAYNAEAFIEEAIQSVLNQTIKNLELIIIEDHSPDGTKAAASAMAQTDERIRLFCNARNMGVAESRNRGIDNSRGEYIAFLDSDDIWHPDKLEKQLKLIEEKNADIAYCGYSIVNERGEKICADFTVPEEISFKTMLVKNVFSCSTVLLRKSILDVHRFRSDFYHEDFVLWLELLRDGNRAVGIPQALADYRQSENSRSGNKFKAAAERWKVYRKFLGYGIVKSTFITIRYAVLGLIKYRRK